METDLPPTVPTGQDGPQYATGGGVVFRGTPGRDVILYDIETKCQEDPDAVTGLVTEHRALAVDDVFNGTKTRIRSGQNFADAVMNPDGQVVAWLQPSNSVVRVAPGAQATTGKGTKVPNLEIPNKQDGLDAHLVGADSEGVIFFERTASGYFLRRADYVTGSVSTVVEAKEEFGVADDGNGNLIVVIDGRVRPSVASGASITVVALSPDKLAVAGSAAASEASQNASASPTAPLIYATDVRW